MLRIRNFTGIVKLNHYKDLRVFIVIVSVRRMRLREGHTGVKGFGSIPHLFARPPEPVCSIS